MNISKAICLLSLIYLSLCAIKGSQNSERNLQKLREIVQGFARSVESAHQSRLLQTIAKQNLSINCNSFCLFLDCNGCQCSDQSCAFCFWNNGRQICLECDDQSCTGCTENCTCTTCPNKSPQDCLTFKDQECDNSEAVLSLKTYRSNIRQAVSSQAQTKNIENQQKEIIAQVMEKEQKLMEMESQIQQKMEEAIFSPLQGGSDSNETQLKSVEQNQTEDNQTEDNQTEEQPQIVSNTVQPVNQNKGQQTYTASEQVKMKAMNPTVIKSNQIDQDFSSNFCQPFCESLGNCSDCYCGENGICISCVENTDLCMQCDTRTKECYGCTDCLCYSCKNGQNCDFFSHENCTKEQFGKQLQAHHSMSQDNNPRKKVFNTLENTDVVCGIFCNSYFYCKTCSCEGDQCNICLEEVDYCPVCELSSLQCSYCDRCTCYRCNRKNQCEVFPDPNCD